MFDMQVGHSDKQSVQSLLSLCLLGFPQLSHNSIENLELIFNY